MTSPLVFWSWAEAEGVMLEGEELLKKVQVDIKRNREEVSNWQGAVLHNMRVALVWVLGSRLPRYVVQMSLLILAVTMAIRPHVGVLLAAAYLILFWSLILASAIVLDVRVMLYLRKHQPRDEVEPYPSAPATQFVAAKIED